MTASSKRMSGNPSVPFKACWEHRRHSIAHAEHHIIHIMMPDGRLQTTGLDYSVFSLMKLLLQPIKQREHLDNELKLFVLWFAYLEVRGQLMWGEDTQFDLRKTDLQVLKIIAFWGSRIFAGFLVKVFIQLFHLWNTKSLTCQWWTTFPIMHCGAIPLHTLRLSIAEEREQLQQELLLNDDCIATCCDH